MSGVNRAEWYASVLLGRVLDRALSWHLEQD